MNVGDAMAKDVQTVAVDAPLVEVAQRMLKFDIGSIPVTKDGLLVGVITDRDMVVRCIAEGRVPTQMHAADVMSVEIVCCFAEQDTEEAKALMSEHNVRRLPVIDKEHHVIGVLSRSNLFGATPAKKPIKVTFHRQMTDGRGQPRKVPVKTIYITGARGKEDAEARAVDHLERDHGTHWRNVATGYDVEDPSSGKS